MTVKSAFRKTALASGVALFALAAPTHALDLGAYVELVGSKGVDSTDNYAGTVEFGLEAEHESGAYGALIFTSTDLLNESEGELSEIEINAGFAYDISEMIGVDLGASYYNDTKFTTSRGEGSEAYLGVYSSPVDNLDVSLYFFQSLDTSDSNYIELEGAYDFDAFDAYALYTYEMFDGDEVGQSLELGAGKGLSDNTYINLAYIADLKKGRNGAFELTWTYSF